MAQWVQLPRTFCVRDIPSHSLSRNRPGFSVDYELCMGHLVPSYSCPEFETNMCICARGSRTWFPTGLPPQPEGRGGLEAHSTYRHISNIPVFSLNRLGFDATQLKHASVDKLVLAATSLSETFEACIRGPACPCCYCPCLRLYT